MGNVHLIFPNFVYGRTCYHLNIRWRVAPAAGDAVFVPDGRRGRNEIAYTTRRHDGRKSIIKCPSQTSWPSWLFSANKHRHGRYCRRRSAPLPFDERYWRSFDVNAIRRRRMLKRKRLVNNQVSSLSLI